MLKHKTRLAAACTAVALAAGTLAAAGSASAAPEQVRAKSAFVIGWSSADSGSIAFPAMADAAQAAMQYINTRGGINGHPLVIAFCGVDASPEKNQACGQQFANDKRLSAVVAGWSLAFGPFYQALTPIGMPIYQAVPVYPADYAAPNSVSYVGGGIAPPVGIAEMANTMKTKTVAFLGVDGPSVATTFGYFMARYKGPKDGVKNVVVPTTATDAIPYLTQAGATTADAVVFSMPNCLPFARAAAQLKIPATKILAIGSCLNATNLASNPVMFEGYRAPYYVQDPLFGFGFSKELDTFLKEYPKYAKLPTSPIGTFATQAWSAILSLQTALRGAPDSVLYNKKALISKLRAFKGPVTLASPGPIKCGSIQGSPDLCTLYTVKAQVQGGKLKRIAG